MWRRFLSCLMLAMGLVSRIAAALDDPQIVIPMLLARLADPQQSAAEKNRLEAVIVAQEIHAIPILINHLEDKRAVGQIFLTKGECMNLPRTATPPSDCLDAVDITLGRRAEDLLYRILLKDYTPPKGAGRGKTNAEWPFVVKNWKQWWTAHHKDGLSKLRATARALADRFWRRGPEGGPVAWQ